MSEPTRSFDLTEGQLIALRFVLERGVIEFLEYRRDSSTPPGDFDRVIVDKYVELCEVFGVDIPEVPERPES